MKSIPNRFIIAAGIGFLIIGMYVVNLVRTSSQGTRASVQATKTFTPSVIPLSAPELLNSNRGLYRWQGGEVVPIGDGSSHDNTSQDVYDRFTWNVLETSQGQYDFSRIEAGANQAQARGGTFSFRIYMFCESWCDAVSVPNYIASNPSYNGWYKNYGSRAAYVPDWNNEQFLQRWEALIAEMGARYNNDPRISMIDITGYGNWGEGHMSCIYNSHESWCTNKQTPPAGIQDITTANKQRMVNAYARAFPNKRLMALQGDTETLLYSFSLDSSSNPPVTRAIGWRNDCLGLHTRSINGSNKVVEHFRGKVQYDDPTVWSAIQDRWKIAPISTEFCPIYPERTLETDLQGNPVTNRLIEPEVALNQIKDYHVSLVSNGNIGSRKWVSNTPIGGTNQEKWNAFSSTEKNMLFDVGKHAGYRFVVEQMTLPESAAPGQSISITTHWKNVGVAPAYEPWKVYIEIRNQTGELKARVVSQINLETLLPSATASEITDIIALPSDMSHETYSVGIIVEDATLKADNTPYRLPMKLAIEGREPYGGYPIGELVVNSVTSTPISTTPSNTPTQSVTLTPVITVGASPSVTPILSTNPTISTTPPVSITLSPDQSCPLQPKGDANCDQVIDELDYIIWRSVYKGEPQTGVAKYRNPDFNNDKVVDMKDFEIWMRHRSR